MKVAVIGSGISGLGCAWLLSKTHSVVVLERSHRLGGHARTIDAELGEETVAVDTGFIVFNKKNYPNLTALFEHLNVPIAPSKMSFGVTFDTGKFEYGTGGLNSFLGQPKNLFRPKFWRMFADILRFNREALNHCEQSGDATLGELLDDMNLSHQFREAYLLPMTASIWSTPASKMLLYPARSILSFLENHGLLTLFKQPQWFTVKGGSREYLDRLLQDFRGEQRTGVHIQAVKRGESEIIVEFADGTIEHFDKVVFACRPQQTLEMLIDASETEREILGGFASKANRVLTHEDQNYMPKRRACWSSWTYTAKAALDDKRPAHDEISLTYWMNNLQPLGSKKPLFVTMNPADEPDKALVKDDWQTDHPMFDHAAIRAQKLLQTIQGVGNIFHCGAWTGHGFHEDGLRSGLAVAEHMHAQVPWRSGQSANGAV